METIIIGFGEALSAPEVAWDLIDHGFKVVAFYRRGVYPPLLRLKEIQTYAITPPELDTQESIKQLNSIVKISKAKTLLPLDDASLWLCDQVSKFIEIPISGATGDAANLALNKEKQLIAAQKTGFSIPHTELISKSNDLNKIRQLPIVLKPCSAVSERNGKLFKDPIFFCLDKDDLNRVAVEYHFKNKLIAQPFLSGIGEGIFGLNGPDGVKKWSAHRRIRMLNPLGSGSCACKSINITDHPLQAIEKMLKKVNWPSMFMIELLRDSNGQLWFMELNGRSWGSMALAIRMGLHYPAWTVMQTLDPFFEPPETSKCESITCRHLGREIIHLLSVLKGKKAYKLLPNYSRINAFLEICRFNRNDRWYNWHSGHSIFFFEDTIKTVANKLISVLR